MKKVLVLVLTALTITAMTGCGAKNEKVDNGESSMNSSGSIVEQSKSEMLFAKVKKIVGNEISVKLSEDSFSGLDGGEGIMPGGQGVIELDESQLAELEAGGTVSLGDGAVVGTVTIDPDALAESDPSNGVVIPAEPAPGMESGGASSDGVVIFDGVEADGDMFSEIEFNGEEKDLIIPAGVEIFNMKTGKTGNISDIKEGSILSIVIDSNTNTVTRIDIMG